MKKITLISLLSFFSLITFAQSEKYTNAMKKNILPPSPEAETQSFACKGRTLRRRCRRPQEAAAAVRSCVVF